MLLSLQELEQRKQNVFWWECKCWSPEQGPPGGLDKRSLESLPEAWGPHPGRTPGLWQGFRLIEINYHHHHYHYLLANNKKIKKRNLLSFDFVNKLLVL